MHVNKLLADLNYNLGQNQWIDRLPSKKPTGGVAWAHASIFDCDQIVTNFLKKLKSRINF